MSRNLRTRVAQLEKRRRTVVVSCPEALSDVDTQGKPRRPRPEAPPELTPEEEAAQLTAWDAVRKKHWPFRRPWLLFGLRGVELIEAEPESAQLPTPQSKPPEPLADVLSLPYDSRELPQENGEADYDD